MLQPGLTLLASLVLFVIFPGSVGAQSRSAAAIVDDFAQAWNTHDPKAFDRLFTEEVVWVPTAEVRAEGRTALVRELAEAHASWAKNTTVTQSDTKIQSVGADVAVIFFHSSLAGRAEDGTPIPSADRAMVVVAVKQSDGWRIAAGQVTKPVEGRD
jgi:uncharacterized protein (TIGR02246 family)